MNKRVHFCISIDGVLRHSDAQLRKDHCTWITRDDGSKMTPTELRTMFCEWKARGFDAVPTCDNYDDRGHCKGHEIAAEAVS
jgi:hypothetical protein